MKKILILIALSLFILTSCAQMENLRQINTAQDIRIRQLEKKNDEISRSYYDEKTQHANDNQSSKIKLKELQSEVSRLEKSRSDREKDLDLSQTNLQLQVQTLKEDRDKIQADLSSQIAQLTSDNTQFKQQNDDLTKQVHSLSSENASIKQKNEQQKAKVEALDKKVKDAQMEIAGLEQQISDKESEIKTLTASLAGREKNSANIEKKITDLESTIKKQSSEQSAAVKRSIEEQKSNSAYNSDLDAVYDSLKTGLSIYLETKNLHIKKDKRGVVVIINANVLFPPNSTIVKESSKNMFAEISLILKKYPGTHVNVEGHTDDKPVENMPFADNWALSSARATNVLRFMVDNEFIEADRIRAIAAGSSFPLFPNNTAENRAKNRRVELVIYY